MVVDKYFFCPAKESRVSRRQILGTYDLEKKVEDTVVLLDSSDRFYGDPSRASLIERGLIELVQAKHDLDSSDRFALVSFGETTSVDLEFDSFTPAAFVEAIAAVETKGAFSYVAEAISVGLQLLIKELQRLSTGKLMRMLVVSDGNFHVKQKDWEELVRDAKGIGIYVDCIQVIQPGFRGSEVLRRVARITEGDYLECGYEDFPNNAPSFAVKKRKVSASQTTEDKGLPPALLEKIAADLDAVDAHVQTAEDLRKIALAETDFYKCAICRTEFCMMCRGPPYACGAHCPQCGRFMHIHCAAGWAANSKDTPPNVLKCPVCFFLLKVPGSLSRIETLKKRLEGMFDADQDKGFDANKKLPQYLAGGLHRACAYCHGLLDPEEEAYQCGNPECLAVYHERCYEEVSKESGDRCRACDRRMNLRLGAHPGVTRIV
ncbi:MAG: hypothetical protein Kow0069_18790 [Promethearchaeota archaeon]